ncbi:hypothetical protein KC343_g7230 [Hortaea werneckii]|nr:hypothetical protein KC352_g18884 [Hortaea werneckii]KAI7563722.1 hypothetical protein KC317_g7544 [Hortaea werneckii]KAI7613990.1 hypothetical protein KC346_g7126 [Hortaea werneckii]KAI7623641.1 hypothetical protein KC343_g7230 [Hortaea werneckii]KAI7665838.1 hypothetical protein KC319_g7116 [Hortaea werneckii]
MTASILTKPISTATTYDSGIVHLQQISNTGEDSIRDRPNNCLVDPPGPLDMASVGVMLPLIVNDPTFVPVLKKTMAMSDMPIKPDDPMFMPLIPDMEDAVEEAAMDIVEDAVAIPDIPDISIDVGVEVVEVVMLILLMSIAVEYR